MTHERHCLLFHGFTGGPFEVEPLADYLRQQGYHCRVPTLPGHDPELAGLGGVNWRQWLEAAASEAYLLTKEHGPIDLVGFSMGGLISTYIANRFPIKRLVLLSAAAIYVSPIQFVSDVADCWRRRDWGHWGRAKRTPVTAALEFMKLARFTKQRELPRVIVPTLVIQGRRDQIVHPRSAKYIYNRLTGDKELLYLPQARHMVCLEPGAAEWFGTVERFLNKP